ncbi:hypothetical protein KPL74_15565 [Bacillus sp. NP157]|nr:hypothetical protein KPL74_15565 [Bacillus sp. NP157]
MSVRSIPPVVAIAVAYALPGYAAAGSVTTTRADLDEGNLVALLEASSQRHVDAMRSIIVARYPGDYRARRWELVESHMRSTPIARLEYTYTSNGISHVRTYHAMAGEPLGRVAVRAFAGPTPPGTPSTPSSPELATSASEAEEDAAGSQAAVSDEALAAAETADEPFYVASDATDVRAPFRMGGRSIMKPYWHDGRYHALDAEQKALRALEDDILGGVVPRSGTVRGMLSGVVCHTCRWSIGTFADAYDLDIQLTEMSPTIPSALKKELIASGRARLRGLKLIDAGTERPMVAFDALAGARAAQVRDNISPAAMERTASGKPWPQRSFRLGQPRPRRITEASASPSEGSDRTSSPEREPPDC